MSVAFWSVQLKAGKPVEVQPPEGYVLNLQLASLQGENEKCAVVKVDTLAIEGDPLSAVVCTLRTRTADQVNVNLVFGYDVSTKFSFTGDKSSSVYLSGYFQPAPEDMGSDSEDEYGDAPSDGESDSEDEAPVGADAKGKMVVEEDSEDSEDEDMEDDSVDEEFIKKMIKQNSAGADDDDSEEDDEEEEEDSEEEESEEELPPAKAMKPAAGKSTPGKAAPQKPTTPQTGNKNKNNTPQAKGSSGKQAWQQKSGDKRKR